MKQKIVSFLVAVSIVTIIVLTWWYGNLQSRRMGSITVAPPLSGLIQTDLPQRRDFSIVSQWFGFVESTEKVKIVALEDGRIVSVDAGDEIPVQAGTLLFTMGGPLIEGRMEVLRKKMRTLKERTDLAEHVYTIKKNAAAQKLVKEEEFIFAEDALKRLKAEREAVAQQINLLKQAVRIRAPVNGVFSNRRVSPGQEVEKNTTLAELVSVKHLRVAATLFPPMETVIEGKKAVIKLPNGDLIFGAVIKEFPQHTAEGATTVWIEGPDLNRRLRPGETVGGKIELSWNKNALTVPESAIVRDEKEQTYIFLKEPEKYRRQPVQTGMVSGGWVEVKSGLKDEDQVVVQGAYELFYQNFKKLYKVVD